MIRTEVGKTRRVETAKIVTTAAWLAISVAAAVITPGSTARSADTQAGLTGISRPDEVIMARQLVMDSIEAEMMRLEAAVAAARAPALDGIKDRAYTVYSYFSAVAHLFPPETRPQTAADGTTNGTSATAAVWDEFDAFYESLQAAAATAFDASQAADMGAFKQQVVKLRDACDSCHAKYMHVAEPN